MIFIIMQGFSTMFMYWSPAQTADQAFDTICKNLSKVSERV